MKQKFCTKCGAPLIEGKNFCTHCGTKIAQNNPEQSLENCDSPNEDIFIHNEQVVIKTETASKESLSTNKEQISVETSNKSNITKEKSKIVYSEEEIRNAKKSLTVVQTVVLVLLFLISSITLYDFVFSALVFIVPAIRHAIYDGMTTNNFFVVPFILSIVSLMMLSISIIFRTKAVIPLTVGTFATIFTIVAGHFLLFPFSIPSIILTFTVFVYIIVCLIYLINSTAYSRMSNNNSKTSS